MLEAPPNENKVGRDILVLHSKKSAQHWFCCIFYSSFAHSVHSAAQAAQSDGCACGQKWTFCIQDFVHSFFVRLIFFITQFVVIHPPNVVLFAPFRQSTHSTLGAIGWLPTSPLLSNLIHFSIFSFDTFELPRSDSLLGDTIGLNECRKRNEKILKQKNGRRKRSEKMCSTKCIECNATEQYFRVSSATGETI